MNHARIALLAVAAVAAPAAAQGAYVYKPMPLNTAGITFRLRSVHDSRVTLGPRFRFHSASGDAIQTELYTAFGPIRLMQRPRQKSYFGPGMVPSTNLQRLVRIGYVSSFHGVTRSGYQYLIFTRNHRTRIHCELPDSSIDALVPGEVPGNVLSQLLEEIY